MLKKVMKARDARASDEASPLLVCSFTTFLAEYSAPYNLDLQKKATMVMVGSGGLHHMHLQKVRVEDEVDLGRLEVDVFKIHELDEGVKDVFAVVKYGPYWSR